MSTAYDLVRGVQLARRLAREGPAFDMVHVRSYPCALIAHRLFSERGLPYLFDLRGFYPEERVDGGLWREGGTLFRLTKRLERPLLRDAGAVVTLTEASRPLLHERMRAAGAAASVHVIPTAVDLSRFRLTPIPESPHLVYLGSIGTWYLLPEMAALARAFLDKEPTGRVTFLTNGEHQRVRAAMGDLASTPRVAVRAVSHERVPDELATATATFALIRPSPSKVASAPTKFGESLAVGAPLLVNPGVGDVAELVRGEGVGVVVDPDRTETYGCALDALLALAGRPGIRERCRAVAERYLDLEDAADRYQAAYREVMASAVRVAPT